MIMVTYQCHINNQKNINYKLLFNIQIIQSAH